MKKSIALVFMTMFVFASSMAKTINATFDDTGNLPDGIIVCDGYFERTNKIFLKLQDYGSSYSKIVEYDTEELEISKTIFSCEKGFSIRDFNSTKNGFVFSVTSFGGGEENHVYFSDIYHYDCFSGELAKINEKPISESTRGYYPCEPHLNEKCALYLRHDFESEKSEIVMYDFATKKSDVIAEEKFPENTTGITFLDVDGEKMLYNSFNQEKPELHVFDLATMEKIKTVSGLRTSYVHYNGCLDYEAGTMVLYAASSRFGDLIYMIDLDSGKSKKLVGFRDYSLIKNDQMYFDGRNIMYTVQMDVSGYISDHYYAEIYDTQKLQSSQKPHTAYCFLTKDWKGFLIYDSKARTNKIHMQFIKKGASD